MAKKNIEGKKLFVVVAVFFALGVLFSYSIVFYAGLALMIAGLLPASGNHDDPV